MQPPNGGLCRLQIGRRKPCTRGVRRTSPPRAGEARAGRIAATSPMGHHSAMVRAILAWMLAVCRPRSRPRNRSSSASTPQATSRTRTRRARTGEAGRTVELPKAETREDTSAWEAAAREAGRVVRGMPKRWVLRSRGAPAEIRPGDRARGRDRGVALRRQGRRDARGLRRAQRRVGARGHEPGRREPPQRRRRGSRRRAKTASARRAESALRDRRTLLRARVRGDRRRRSRGAAARPRRRRMRHRPRRSSAISTSPRPAIRRCARCSAASTARSPTSSAP